MPSDPEFKDQHIPQKNHTAQSIRFLIDFHQDIQIRFSGEKKWGYPLVIEHGWLENPLSMEVSS